MNSLRRPAKLDDEVITVISPITEAELDWRRENYHLDQRRFARHSKDLLFRPVSLLYDSKVHTIQANFCINPFCSWFGLEQKRFGDVKHKPYRYKLIGIINDSQFSCNPPPPTLSGIYVAADRREALSNWSLALEIARLATLDTIVDNAPNYQFHREGCPNSNHTPDSNPKAFHRRGRSSSGSTKWQCIKCRKITNEMATRRRCFTYRQKRSEIMPLFANLLVNKTPVRRTCEILGIGSQTYYDKLELLYRRCLEFLDKHEKQNLAKLRFETLWLNSDSLQYYLNNVRMKGSGGNDWDKTDDKYLQTDVVVTADMDSRYVFRTDVAYDWEISLTDIENDTLLYRDDKTHSFSRKNDRLRVGFTYYPSPEDKDAFEKFHFRSQYANGLHVRASYTAFAHYWLIRQYVNAKNWRFVTDKDSSLISALMRVFKDEILQQRALHFTCSTVGFEDNKQRYAQFKKERKELLKWATDYGLSGIRSWNELAFHRLKAIADANGILEYQEIDGVKVPIAGIEIPHPKPDLSQGTRVIKANTGLSQFSPDTAARLLMNVNNHAVDSFIQQIRRRISILERPLKSARGTSYVYSNFNPRYAHYALTILRTYYNYCMTFKRNKISRTPAQRLGLAEKQYDWKDIIYFK